MKQQKQPPFFAKFLEQQKEKEVVGGAGPTSVLKDVAYTQKYPSDGDEYAVTMKYPSDSDEGIAM
jgi:Serine endopeptidase inhibitors